MNLQKFVALKFRKEEGNVATVKDYQSFHKRNIFLKTSNILLIILRMANSNQPHMNNIQFIVLMSDNHIRMSMPDLNVKYYLPPVTNLEDNEN